jgi:hypothetical protein
MASIWKHPNSRYWTACWRDHNGRQRRKSTKATSRRLAQSIADEFEREFRDRRTFRHLRKTLERFHEELTGRKIKRVSLRTYVADWLSAKKPTVSARTNDFYTSAAHRFLEFLGERADLSIEEITRADIVAYRNKLAGQVVAKTANHYIKGVKMLFRAARADEVVTENPAEFVKGVRADNGEKIQRAFTIGELQTVLAAADPEWKSMVLFGLYTGQRLIDLALLCHSNVD